MKYVALVYYQESIINSMSEKEWHDLNEALQLASRIPPARFGSIEVRPVRELPPKD